MNITLDYYRIFYYVGKLGQITLAAKELSLTQPAVSQAIRQLEAQLDTRLFLRTPKGVVLTVEGALLHDHVSRGYETILLGEKRLLQLRNLETGAIHIGASDMTLRFYLLPFLEQFHEQYPQIKISVTNAPTPEILHYLEDGEIDFGIVSTPIPSERQISVYPVKEFSDQFICGSRFSHLKNKPLTYEELTKYPLIFLEKNTSTRRGMDEWMAKSNVILQPEFELATSDMIVQFAIRNLGIGCVMEGFAQEYIEDEQLFALSFQQPLPTRQFCIVTDELHPLSTAATVLLKLFSY